MAFLSNKRIRAAGLAVAILFGVFLALQLVRPHLGNPPVVADLKAPADVKQILVTSCYDCHSNETKLHWFDQIVPGYWLVVRDVRHGRARLNFSSFGKLGAAQQKALLYESVNMIRLGTMPPRQYLLLHGNTAVTPAQIATLENDLHSPDAVTNPTDPAEVAKADADYRNWIELDGTKPAQNVKPAPNGLTFPADYKDWKPISFTDRFDNDTHRIILGNDTAQKAIAAQQTHPWPDGTAFAKIAIAQQHDDQGIAQAGHFIQAEFMVKDAAKYASTDGWGFGRWKTDNLVPYGKNANFATECVSCHAPMAANDHVYTEPIRATSAPSDVFNSLAALPGDLPASPLQMRAISVSVDRGATEPHRQGRAQTESGYEGITRRRSSNGLGWSKGGEAFRSRTRSGARDIAGYH